MVVRTFYTRAWQARDGYAGLQDGGPLPATVLNNPGHGPTIWATGGSGANHFGVMAFDATQSTFAASHHTTGPTASPINAYRTSRVLSGSFAAGNWPLSVSVIASAAAGTVSGKVHINIWRSPFADGSHAVRVNASDLVGSTVTALSISVAQQSTVSGAMPAFTLRGQFLFFVIEWEVTSAGSGGDGVQLRPGAQTFFSTTDFTLLDGEPPTIYPEIDWQGLGWDSATDGTVQAYCDVKRDYVAGNHDRGASYASYAQSQPAVGQSQFQLQNTDGLYSRWNSGGILYGHIEQGHRLRYRMTAPVDAELWNGKLSRVDNNVTVQQIPYINFEAQGMFSDLMPPVVVSPAPNIGSTAGAPVYGGTLVNTVLDAAGWSATARSIEPGTVPMAAWSEFQANPLSALSRIKLTEVAILTEGADGSCIFQQRDHRLTAARSTTSQVTFSDADGWATPYIHLELDDPRRFLYDLVTLSVEPALAFSSDPIPVFNAFRPNAYHIAVEPRDPVSGDPGAREFVVLYVPGNVTFSFTTSVDPHSSDRNLPVGSTQDVSGLAGYVATWTLPTLSGATVDLRPIDDSNNAIDPSLLTVTQVAATANSYAFIITNAGDKRVFFSVFQVRGVPVIKQPAMTVTAGTGVRLYPAFANWFDGIGDAQSAANWLLDYFVKARDIVSMDVDPRASLEVAAAVAVLDISDRFTVEATGNQTRLEMTEDFFCEYQQWTYSDFMNAITVTVQGSGVVPNSQVAPGNDYGIYNVSTYNSGAVYT